ncbi:MAG: GH39 family glycosyl hydrolase [Acidimicrobiales bacterium]
MTSSSESPERSTSRPGQSPTGPAVDREVPPDDVPAATDRSAGAAWEERVGRTSDDAGEVELPQLPPPQGLAARAGRGQVTLDWEPVDGAAGYLVRRAERRNGKYQPLEIGEPWVRPVPHPPLTDTTGRPGQAAWYTVAAVAAVDDHGQPASQPVQATPRGPGHGHATDAGDDQPASTRHGDGTDAGDHQARGQAADNAIGGLGDGVCRIAVDAAATTGPVPRPWRPMIGAEHLSQLDYGVGPGGRPIGDEFAAALRMAHDQLGVRAVRAHSILHDELGVYREIDGQPVHDFTAIDRIYDRLLALGLRPIVEISFMPRDLARDPDKTVFEHRAIVSPPKDWHRWEHLVTALVDHLVDRYGRDEVRGWGFEVWNEANLEVFWSGTRSEYLRLYDVTARAVRSVDPELTVGGPASAAVGWLDELLAHVGRSGAPLDFLSTHTYGNAPLDLRPIAARHGRPDLPLWWTEWGAHASHFNGAHDSVWSAAYLVRGMVSAMGRLDALAYWTVSDHFEELGRPTKLLHGGFGLLSVGNLRKPRWWGLWMLEQLGSERLVARVDGDGGGDLVNAVASRDGDGRLAIVAWNGTVDVTKIGGDPLLDRSVRLRLTSLPASRYRLRHRRLDQRHSDLNAAWAPVADGQSWPDEAGWRALQAADRLEDLEPPRTVSATDGTVDLAFDLPMPGVSLLELTRVDVGARGVSRLWRALQR